MKKFKYISVAIVFALVFSIAVLTVNFLNIVRAEGAIPITSWAELHAIRNNLSGSYILMNDLDETTEGYATYAGATANAGSGFEPIGTITGIFDGNNHTITGLYINRPLTDLVGVISSTAEIKNVGLIDIDVTGGNYVGGLSSGNSGTITNSYVTGSVSGTNYVGGLVGSNGGIINNAYSTGTVSGTERVGGLVGQDFSGTTSESYSTAAVNGTSFVGGLYGWNQGTINSSYSTGAVSGIGSVGGLVGISGTNINNSYSTGNITRNSGSNTNFGGFVGWQSGWTITNSYSTGTVLYTGVDNPTNKGFAGLASGTITNSFWDTTTSEQITSAGAATSKTTSEMKTLSTFTDASWDFDTLWSFVIGHNNDYPIFQWQEIAEEPGSDTTPPFFQNLPNSSDVINVTNDQIITTNPFIIKVKPTDNLAISNVKFWIDDNLICTVTTSDSDGIYFCAWDTSKYHSTVKVIAYDSAGNSAQIIRNATVDPKLYLTVLPKTGK